MSAAGHGIQVVGRTPEQLAQFNVPLTVPQRITPPPVLPQQLGVVTISRATALGDPDKHPATHCWWCVRAFGGGDIRYPIPYEYDERANKYFTYGSFCTASCAKAFLLSSDAYSRSRSQAILDNFRRMLATHYAISRRVPVYAAPPRTSLAMFGGPLTHEEFHAIARAPEGARIYGPRRPIVVHSEEFYKEVVDTYGSLPAPSTTRGSAGGSAEEFVRPKASMARLRAVERDQRRKRRALAAGASIESALPSSDQVIASATPTSASASKSASMDITKLF